MAAHSWSRGGGKRGIQAAHLWGSGGQATQLGGALPPGQAQRDHRAREPLELNGNEMGCGGTFAAPLTHAPPAQHGRSLVR